MGGFTFARSNIAFRAARRFSSRSPIFEPSATAVLIVVAAIGDRAYRFTAPAHPALSRVSAVCPRSTSLRVMRLAQKFRGLLRDALAPRIRRALRKLRCARRQRHPRESIESVFRCFAWLSRSQPTFWLSRSAHLFSYCDAFRQSRE